MKIDIKLLFALLFLFCLGFLSTQNTMNGFGILTSNNLDAQVLAQLGTTDENGNGGSTPGIYDRKDKDYKTKTCTLHKKFNAQGQVSYSEDEFEIEAGYSYTTVPGLVETCPTTKKGAFCIVFSCHVTLNTLPGGETPN